MNIAKHVFVFGCALVALFLVSNQNTSGMRSTRIAVDLTAPDKPFLTWDQCETLLRKRNAAIRQHFLGADRLMSHFPTDDNTRLAWVTRNGQEKLMTKQDVSFGQEFPSGFNRLIHEALEQEHRSVQINDNSLILFPNNVVVHADVPTCTIMGVYLPRLQGSIHPAVAETIETRGVHADKKKKKKKKTPTPPPTFPPVTSGSVYKCVSAKSGFASITMPKSGRLVGIELNYRSGEIYHCGSSNKACYSKFGGQGGLLGMWVTKQDETVMYPKQGTGGFDSSSVTSFGFYKMNGYSGSSTQLNFIGPIHRVQRKQRLKIMFGEVLRNKGKRNNGGQTCFYVTLHFTNDNEAQRKSDRALAYKFLPYLYFSKEGKEFPMDAQKYFDKCKNGGSKCYEENKVMANTVTYYKIVRCNDQIRIVYRYFYGNQKACIKIGNIWQEGDHRGDWERVIVTLSLDKSQVAAVTYHQHGGRLTRVKGDFPSRNGRPIAYIAKNAHGAYPGTNRGIVISECLYYADHRTPNSRSKYDSQKGKLINLDPWFASNSQSWMRDMGFCTDYGCEIKNKPQSSWSEKQKSDDYCASYKSCEDGGCERTGCLKGKYKHACRTLKKCCTNKVCGIFGKCKSNKFRIPFTDKGLTHS